MDMFENFGLDFIVESEDTYRNFLGMVCTEGKAIVGYYGTPYLNMECGDSQFVARTELNNNRLEVTGMDTHAPGRAIWEVLLSSINLQPKDADTMSRRVVVKRESDGGGMAVVNLVNADVLPSFLEDEKVKMQVIAFPELIHFYADEDAYALDQPKGENGKAWMLADGSMMPVGIFSNHSPDSPDKDKDHYSDSFMLIRGTVKGFSPGIIKIADGEFESYIVTKINTEFGDLEIIHTLDQIDESERENLRAGAIVNGIFVLSGDVAIYEYNGGVVRDEQHNLALLRYTLQEGETRRMQAVLKDTSVYVSEASNKEWCGTQAIIDRFQYVRDSNPETKFIVHKATITSVDDGDEELPYGVDKRCLVMAEDEKDNYTSIVFLDIDEEGYIAKLTISRNSRYHFKIDEPVKHKNVLDDIKIPDSVAEPLISRARFHGFLDYEITDEAVLERQGNVKTYEENAKNVLESFDDYSEIDNDEKYANIFGYLFAKAIESDYSWQHGDRESYRLVVSYSPGHALTGELYTAVNSEIDKKLKIAHKYGKQFFKDLQLFCALNEDCDFNEELLRALVIVQQIGEVYSQVILVNELEDEKGD